MSASERQSSDSANIKQGGTGMSFVDKICGKIGLGDATEPEETKKEERGSDSMEESQRRLTGQDNIVNFHTIAANTEGGGSRQMKVIIIEPASFDDAQQVADHLKNKKPVVVNFENTDSEAAKRIIDFISGTTYALAGDIKKVGKNVFLCAPSNVNVSYTQDEDNTGSSEMPWLKK